jgi:hypothetical protein
MAWDKIFAWFVFVGLGLAFWEWLLWELLKPS